MNLLIIHPAAVTPSFIGANKRWMSTDASIKPLRSSLVRCLAVAIPGARSVNKQLFQVARSTHATVFPSLHILSNSKAGVVALVSLSTPTGRDQADSTMFFHTGCQVPIQKISGCNHMRVRFFTKIWGEWFILLLRQCSSPGCNTWGPLLDCFMATFDWSSFQLLLLCMWQDYWVWWSPPMRHRKAPGVSESMSDIRVDFFLSAAGGQAASSRTCHNPYLWKPGQTRVDTHRNEMRDTRRRATYQHGRVQMPGNF